MIPTIPTILAIQNEDKVPEGGILVLLVDHIVLTADKILADGPESENSVVLTGHNVVPVVLTEEGFPVVLTVDGVPVDPTEDGVPVVPTENGVPVVPTEDGVPVVPTEDGVPVVLTEDGVPVVLTED